MSQIFIQHTTNIDIQIKSILDDVIDHSFKFIKTFDYYDLFIEKGATPIKNHDEMLQEELDDAKAFM